MKPGAVLSQKYRLVSLLGEGGMGAVWRAEDVRLGSAPVAIKLMHGKDAANPELRSRFDAEARIAAKLRSPHVVQLYDVGVDEATGAPFLAMELLEGETLHDRLSRLGAIPAAEVAHVVSHVSRALTWAHSLGIVHRDLKPANIFLVQNADAALAKVLDFGVAKRATQSIQQGRTATGVLLGTPLYMSPEQILSAKDVDHRADLWSLAVIAVQCLTGRLPFDSDNLPGLALQICHGKAAPPSRLGVVPQGFDEWFERATRPRPEERFHSATQMSEALRAICVPHGSGAEPAHSVKRATVAAGPATELAPVMAAASVMPLSSTALLPLGTPRHKRGAMVGLLGAAAVAVVAAAWLVPGREPALPVLPAAAVSAPAAVRPMPAAPAHVAPAAAAPASAAPAVFPAPAPADVPASSTAPFVAPLPAATASEEEEAPPAHEPAAPVPSRPSRTRDTAARARPRAPTRTSSNARSVPASSSPRATSPAASPQPAAVQHAAEQRAAEQPAAPPASPAPDPFRTF